MLSTFPVQLFLTLVGVTYLFAIAQNNGTVDLMVRGAVRLVRGNVRTDGRLILVDQVQLTSSSGSATGTGPQSEMSATLNLVAFDYDSQAADYNHVGYNEPDTVLIAQLMGMRKATPAGTSPLSVASMT